FPGLRVQRDLGTPIAASVAVAILIAARNPGSRLGILQAADRLLEGKLVFDHSLRTGSKRPFERVFANNLTEFAFLTDGGSRHIVLVNIPKLALAQLPAERRKPFKVIGTNSVN